MRTTSEMQGEPASAARPLRTFAILQQFCIAGSVGKGCANDM